MTTPTTTDPLLGAAESIIAAGQHDSGAYIASPAFGQYAFGWLRDGSYVALAMDALDHRASSRRFHEWAAGVIVAHAADIAAVVAAVDAGRAPDPAHLLPTRYTLEGAREEHAGEAWPNFQLDGYGTWLFALRRHLGDEPVGAFAPAVRMIADYLSACRGMPCYDYWEEFGDRRHTSTLAAMAAGLRAAGDLLDDDAYRAAADDLLRELRERCVVGGAFVKGPDDDRVDASLVSLATPFDLVAVDDPVMVRTIARIRAELSSPTGGIRRYLGDTYYGGNPWPLLTAWLAWHLRRAGDEAGYVQLREWVRGTADPGTGAIPEQLTSEPQPGAEAYIDEWTERWGSVADPLLWSHAKYALMERGDR